MRCPTSAYLRHALVVIGCGCLIVSCSPAGEPTAGGVGTSESPAAVEVTDVLPNGAEPFHGVWTGGQPSEAQLADASRAGIRTVINLRRPDEEGTVGERERVEALGMTYVSIPISGAEDLDEVNARTLADALDGAERPVIVHCRSGNRVGGLFALHAYYVDGLDTEEALAVGRSAGMTGLEPAVRERLERAGP